MQKFPLPSIKSLCKFRSQPLVQLLSTDTWGIQKALCGPPRAWAEKGCPKTKAHPLINSTYLKTSNAVREMDGGRLPEKASQIF